MEYIATTTWPVGLTRERASQGFLVLGEMVVKFWDHVYCRYCRRNVDRVSVDISLTHLDRISVICRRYISQLSVICRSTLGGISVNYRSHISRMSYVSANYWPIHRSSIGQVSANYRRSVGQVSAKCLRGIGDLKAISADIHIDRLSTDYRPTIDRVSIDSRSSVDRYVDRYSGRQYLQ